MDKSAAAIVRGTRDMLFSCYADCGIGENALAGKICPLVFALGLSTSGSCHGCALHDQKRLGDQSPIFAPLIRRCSVFVL
jgi:hypothetical protein